MRSLYYKKEGSQSIQEEQQLQPFMFHQLLSCNYHTRPIDALNDTHIGKKEREKGSNNDDAITSRPHKKQKVV